jgi:MYXO-CTERM domain-containing protein
LNLTAPVGSGDAIGLLWFPSGTSNGSAFGFQDLSMVLPSDGATVTDITTTPGLASNTVGVAGVPEPGRMMLALVGLLGLTLRRRR